MGRTVNESASSELLFAILKTAIYFSLGARNERIRS